jgi:hypothetical protein
MLRQNKIINYYKVCFTDLDQGSEILGTFSLPKPLKHAVFPDELRSEQSHVSAAENAKRALEGQIAELEQRLNEANEAASKGGRNALSRLESRIRELEIELGSCQAKSSETFKAFQKAERRIKELQFQQEEDHKNQVF